MSDYDGPLLRFALGYAYRSAMFSPNLLKLSIPFCFKNCVDKTTGDLNARVRVYSFPGKKKFIRPRSIITVVYNISCVNSQERVYRISADTPKKNRHTEISNELTPSGMDETMPDPVPTATSRPRRSKKTRKSFFFEILYPS